MGRSPRIRCRMACKRTGRRCEALVADAAGSAADPLGSAVHTAALRAGQGVPAMSAVYATTSFWWSDGSGSSQFVEMFSVRDSVSDPVAVAVPGLFSASVPSGLSVYLSANPRGLMIEMGPVA